MPHYQVFETKQQLKVWNRHRVFFLSSPRTAPKAGASCPTTSGYWSTAVQCWSAVSGYRHLLPLAGQVPSVDQVFVNGVSKGSFTNM